MDVVFEHIGKSYHGVHAVRDLNLRIAKGALHFLLGPSGCGKTTTLRMLAGLEAPSSGRILFDGRDVTMLPAAERGIGMVFQNYALWPHMTVRKNIEYGLKQKKFSPAVTAARVAEVLDLAQLTALEGRMPGQLSGGQQQRVALARALAIRPAVLLLDEPLSNLDAQLRLEMRDNISRIHQQLGITTVYVTHDQKEALSMGTEVTVMRGGRLVQSDPPRRLYHQPQTPFVASFVGETNLIKGEYRGQDAGQHLVATRFGQLIAGRSVGTPAVGQTVLVSMRPEAIQVPLTDQPLTGANQLHLSLANRTYLGEMEQFQLVAADQTLLKASVFNPPDHQLKLGDRVICRVDPASLLVLPEDSDLTIGT